MLTEISEDDFHHIDPMFHILTHPDAHTFATLQLPHASQKLGLSWNSATLMPTITIHPTSLNVWIGIDQRLACVSKYGAPLFVIGLFTPFLFIKHFDTLSVALCEMEALVIDYDYSIRGRYHLQDLPDDITRQQEDQVVIYTVTYIDGTTERLGARHTW